MPLSVLKPLRPAEYAEHQLLNAIMNKVYPPGSLLPNERLLAEQLGVTRPTLRETLQRLSREGWVTIRHGKPTRVNDYLKEGGLGVLRSIARFGDEVPEDLVDHLLKVRCSLLPTIAAQAVSRDADRLLAYLSQSPQATDGATTFTIYDWNLQMLMADLSGNPVFRLIMNDFGQMFELLGQSYFHREIARTYSMDYYRKLEQCISGEETGDAVEQLVRETMETVIQIRKQGGT